MSINHDSFSPWIASSAFNPNNSNGYYSTRELTGWKKKEKWYWNAGESTEILEQEIDRIKRRALTFMDSYKKEKIKNPIVQLRLAAYFQMIFELSRHTIQYDHISPLIHRIEARSSDFDKVLRIKNSEENSFRDIFTENNVNVISLKNVNRDIKMLLPMLIAKISYDMHRTKYEQDSIFNLIVDEAHNILSENSTVESEKWKDYRLDVFEEIVKEGRKFGYYLTIASQRPSDISPTIVSQIHNYFIHRLVNDNDLKLLDKTMTSLDYISKSGIPNLSAGQAIITGVSFDLPVIVKISKLSKEEAPNSSNSDLLDIWQVRK